MKYIVILAIALILAVALGYTWYHSSASESSKNMDASASSTDASTAQHNAGVRTVTRAEAHAIAMQRIRETDPNDQYGFTIMDNLTETHDYGWIFHYTTAKYLETKDPKYLVPVSEGVVVQTDGSVVLLPSEHVLQ